MAVRVRRDDLRQRLQVFSLLVAALYVLLVVRIVYLQALNGDYYRRKAHEMRSRRIPLSAQRGSVFDREGRPLAITTYTVDLVCDPTLVKEPMRAATQLAGMLGVPPESLIPGLTAKGSGKLPLRFSVVKEGLTAEQVEAFRAAAGGKKAVRDALAGLDIHERADRSYPTGKAAAHVIGFVVAGQMDVPVGKAGLEQSQEGLLHGTPGFVVAELDGRHRIMPGTQVERRDAADGVSVRLTVDSTIQQIAQGELALCCDKYHPVGATAIVLEPRTGDVLAMVSWPDYDPIDRPDPSVPGKAEAYRNRALSLYEPGSTLKMITAAAALQDQVISPNTVFHCDGSCTIGNRTVKCVLHGSSSGHGEETVRDIIRQSCNVGTAQIGLRVGMARMVRFLDAFGLRSQTGVGLPADYRGRLGFGADANGSGGITKLGRVAFGQSVMVTPLALAEAYACIANGGVLMRPRVVEGTCDPNGRLLSANTPQVVRHVVSPGVAAEIRSYLRDVVTHGTGVAAAVPGYTVAGKTGTAQKVVKGEKGYARGKYVASFIGFLPASAPRAVVFVVVDEPQGEYYGAQVAAPVFRNIAQRLMWYWKVTPDDPASLKDVRAAAHQDSSAPLGRDE